ncbi:MAG: heme-binding protein [Rhodospirillaceae bacterium]|nr:heme-binding protein [Rhodospirillaceae bacterium]|tara:strand:- start:3956 stop:4594 length:639 start_codon:yes stop_codon:yes gene_type:complete
MLRILLIFFSTSLIAGCSVVGIRSSYEQPSFDLIDELNSYTYIRRVPSLLVAETTVDIADYDQSRNVAFKRLFKYISGSNRTQSDIEMTVPVESSYISEQISMTAPVESIRTAEGQMRMRFFLPAEYSYQTAPKPTDQNVNLVKIPAQSQAVLRFNGQANESIVESKTLELLKILDNSGWGIIGDPSAYFYDPPWTISIFRRNEIVISVIKK